MPRYIAAVRVISRLTPSPPVPSLPPFLPSVFFVVAFFFFLLLWRMCFFRRPDFFRREMLLIFFLGFSAMGLGGFFGVFFGWLFRGVFFGCVCVAGGPLGGRSVLL